MRDLERAIADVAENHFFAFVERCEAARFHDLVAAIGEATANAGLPATWISATVPFDGPRCGRVEVLMPEILGAQLLSAVAGVQAEDALADARLLDMPGAFGSMVSRQWLRVADVPAQFVVDHPTHAVRMPDDWVPIEEAGVSVVHLTLGDLPLRVRVSVSGPPPDGEGVSP